MRSGAGASVIVRRPPGTARVHAAAPFTGRGSLPSSSPTSASVLSRDAGGLTYAQPVVAGDPSVDAVLHAHDVERLGGERVAVVAAGGRAQPTSPNASRTRARARVNAVPRSSRPHGPPSSTEARS